MSAGNVRYGQHLLRSWSKDQTVIAMSTGEAELYAACMAAQQAMGTENMARVGSASRRHGTASGRQGSHWNHWQAGIGEIETSGPTLLVAAVSCGRNAGQPEESTVREQHGRSRDEGAGPGEDRSTREEFGSTREEFGMHTIRLVESRTHSRGRCERTPQDDDETSSILTSISMFHPALSIEFVSSHVYNHVHQKQIVCERLSRSK